LRVREKRKEGKEKKGNGMKRKEKKGKEMKRNLGKKCMKSEFLRTE